MRACQTILLCIFSATLAQAYALPVFDDTISEVTSPNSHVGSASVEHSLPFHSNTTDHEDAGAPDTEVLNLLFPRAKKVNFNRVGGKRCVWGEKSTAQSLRAPGYKAHCALDKKTQLQFTNKRGQKDQGTYGNCKNRAKSKGKCQCDHLLELNELHEAINPKTLNSNDRKALCSHFGKVQTDLKLTINSKNNMKPVMQKPNLLKHNLLKGHTIKTKVTHGDVKATIQHAAQSRQNRQQTAQHLDHVLHNVDTSRMPKHAQDAWKKIVPQGAQSNVVQKKHNENNKKFVQGITNLQASLPHKQSPGQPPAKKRKT